jgi:hypothetical protein
MNVRLSIDDAFLREMQQKIGNQATPIDLVREGLTLLNWAVDETARGHVVLSSDTTGTALIEPVLPSLAFIEQRREQAEAAPAEERAVQSSLTLNEK